MSTIAKKKMLQKNILKAFFALIASFLSAFVFKVFLLNLPEVFSITGIKGLSYISSFLFTRINVFKDSLLYIYVGIYFIINLTIILLTLKSKKKTKKSVFFSSLYSLLYLIFVLLLPKTLFTTLKINSIDNNIMYVVLAGLLAGISISITYINGFSAGGTDLLQSSINPEKSTFKIYVNSILFLILIFTFQNIILLIYTILYELIKNITVSKFYVKNKKVMLEIVTTKGIEINDEITKVLKNTSTIYEATGGYSKKDKDLIKVTIFYHEIDKYMDIVKQIDPSSFTNVIEIRNSYGGKFSKVDN